MNLADRLFELRKKSGRSQEELGDLLNVSRQAVSKWESGAALPDTDNIVRLADIYQVTTDYLLTGKLNTSSNDQNTYQSEPKKPSTIFLPFFPYTRYEYKSKRKLFGLPLVHINIGIGAYRAKGIIAIGTIATGLLSIGLISIGLLAFGLLAVGMLALAAFGIGIFAGGAIVVGVLSAGAVAIGIVSFGAVAIGQFAIGAAAFGKWFAYGDHAYAVVAIGRTLAEGTHSFVGDYDRTQVISLLRDIVPKIWQWLVGWMQAIL